MIDKSTVDKIFDAVDIVDVIQDFVPLKKRGANYMACCPFHEEKTPSFSVSQAKGIFKCFGCGKAGNAVTFLQLHENMTYVEALKYLANKYHIEIHERELTPEEQQQNDDRESMMVVANFAQKYFTKTLNETDEGRNIGITYFKERGFTPATIEKFQLGYCLNKYDAFSKQALAEGFKREFLQKTGLSFVDKYDKLGDFFAGRVMFPIHSVSGRVIAFGGRTLKTDKSVAKYKNSPESEIYVKNKTLYALHLAKSTIVKKQKCFLVEGYTDVISMFQAGVENVVASCGTSLTVEQVRLMKRFSPNVTVLYDGDSAGIHASLRGIDMLLEEGLNIKVLLLPDGEDPDSFARSHSASEVEKFIDDNEQDFIAFKTNLLLEEAKGDPIKKAELINDVIKSVSVIPDDITRMVYVQECSKKFDIDEQTLISEIHKERKKKKYGKEYKELPKERAPRQKQETTAVAPVKAEINCDEQERELVYFMLKYGEKPLFANESGGADTVASYIIKEIKKDEITFKNEQYKRIFDEYENIISQQKDYSVKYFTNNADENISKLTVDLISTEYPLSEIWERLGNNASPEEDELKRIVPRAVTLYKTKLISQAIKDFSKELKASIAAGDQEKNKLLMERIMVMNKIRSDLSKELERIVL